MKLLTIFLVACALVGCGSGDKSSDIQVVSTPPDKSPAPPGAMSNVPPAAKDALGGGSK